MRVRSRESVSPRQSPSSLILASINSDGDPDFCGALFFTTSLSYHIDFQARASLDSRSARLWRAFARTPSLFSASRATCAPERNAVNILTRRVQQVRFGIRCLGGGVADASGRYRQEREARIWARGRPMGTAHGDLSAPRVSPLH